MVGNVCLKRELEAAGPSVAALRGLCCCPPAAHGHHPAGCCRLHALAKDKAKPLTPEFNFDLATVGLKSQEDEQLDCKELIPPSPFSSPLCFTPLLSNWPGLLLRNWENKQKIDLGLMGAAVWRMTQEPQRRCSPGKDAQLALYLLLLTSVALRFAVGVNFLGLEHPSRGRLWGPPGAVGQSIIGACCGLPVLWLASNPHLAHVLGPLGVLPKGLHLRHQLPDRRHLHVPALAVVPPPDCNCVIAGERFYTCAGGGWRGGSLS